MTMQQYKKNKQKSINKKLPNKRNDKSLSENALGMEVY